MNTPTEAPWLDDEEQHLWRSWLRVNVLINAEIHRDLQLHSSLSMPDFEVLVNLTDADDDQLRVSELGRRLQWEKSRLSHHLRRMANRGLIARTECSEDARGAFISVTDAGRAAIQKAAPSHVRTVRHYFFDGPERAERRQLGAFLEATLAKLEAEAADVCAGEDN